MEQLTVTQARDMLMGEGGDGVAPDGASAGGAGNSQVLEGSANEAGAESGASQAESEGEADGRAQDRGETQVPAEGQAQARTAPGAEHVDEAESLIERSYADGSVGLGVDIVEIERMAGILQRSPTFAERVFSEAERRYCDKNANPATHYALRFAAKEAVVKALGTGFSDGIWVHDIEVERAANGKPSVKLSGRALEVANEQGVRDLQISLSYTHTDAVACALAVTDAAVKATEKRKDPMEELARQFKKTRSILDEI